MVAVWVAVWVLVCGRVEYRHGAILLIVREYSGFLTSAVTTLWKLCKTENK